LSVNVADNIGGFRQETDRLSDADHRQVQQVGIAIPGQRLGLNLGRFCELGEGHDIHVPMILTMTFGMEGGATPYRVGLPRNRTFFLPLCTEGTRRGPKGSRKMASFRDRTQTRN
jgi:hypothetical protein